MLPANQPVIFELAFEKTLGLSSLSHALLPPVWLVCFHTSAFRTSKLMSMISVSSIKYFCYFLQKSLPELRQAIYRNELTIDGLDKHPVISPSRVGPPVMPTPVMSQPSMTPRVSLLCVEFIYLPLQYHSCKTCR